MQAAEQLQGAIPAAVVDDLSAQRLESEAAAKLGIERRATALALLRLVEKARSSSAVSLFERGLRLFGDLPECIGIDHGDLGENLAVELDPRRRQPAMNWLYDSPPRAAALIRMIHRRRMSRLRALRSR